MIQTRKSHERGAANHGWLDTRHSFSFANYYDPQHMSFRSLRVINEDFIAAGKGFGRHPHRDMEILTYMIEGALEHQDSMGNTMVIGSGEVQRMTAGSGITHSEYNHSKQDQVHLLQIWIEPEQQGLKPSYEQRQFRDAFRTGELGLLASRDGRDGSLLIHQDASLFSGKLAQGDEVVYDLGEKRHGWLQVVRGSVTLNGSALEAGDGAAMSDEPQLKICSNTDSEMLLFDLA